MEIAKIIERKAITKYHSHCISRKLQLTSPQLAQLKHDASAGSKVKIPG